MILRSIRAEGFMKYELLELKDLPKGAIAVEGENFAIGGQRKQVDREQQAKSCQYKKNRAGKNQSGFQHRSSACAHRSGSAGMIRLRCR